MLRSADCGALRIEDVDSRPTLAGWVRRRRDHGGIIFVDLRDRSGLVQVVFNPDLFPEAYRVADQLRTEWVIQVKGLVRRRPAGSENPAMSTGDVEVVADAVSSRSPENRRVGLDKMARAGAEITSVETAIFELMREAGTPQFKEVLRLVQ